jgi:hypothetical protein
MLYCRLYVKRSFTVGCISCTQQAHFNVTKVIHFCDHFSFDAVPTTVPGVKAKANEVYLVSQRLSICLIKLLNVLSALRHK